MFAQSQTLTIYGVLLLPNLTDEAVNQAFIPTKGFAEFLADGSGHLSAPCLGIVNAALDIGIAHLRGKPQQVFEEHSLLGIRQGKGIQQTGLSTVIPLQALMQELIPHTAALRTVQEVIELLQCIVNILLVLRLLCISFFFLLFFLFFSFFFLPISERRSRLLNSCHRVYSRNASSFSRR